jgi:hypothetical protein
MTPDEITAALNRVYADADATSEPVVIAAGVEKLRREQWSTDEEQGTE